MTQIHAIMLCAGMGTRMKSKMSKMLHVLCGKPMCLWPIEVAQQVTSGSVSIVVGHQAEEVQKAIRARGENPKLVFANQVSQNGTGDAVRVGFEGLGVSSGTVIVICGDTPLVTVETLQKLCELKSQSGVLVAMATSIVPNPFGYGRIVRDSGNQVTGIVEEKDALPAQREILEINSGIYAFDAAFLRENIGKIQANNAKSEFYVTDLIALAGKHAVKTLQVSPQEMLGINDRAQMSQAEAILRGRINRAWMLKGVTMQDPANTYVDCDVVLAEDVVLGAGVMLHGKTSIQSGCHILPYTICEDTTIASGCTVGPFAHLRQGTYLDEQAKVGNFVETKKAKFGKKSKANHLAYIGDAEIGDQCNIGAGTITCNYDGFNKNKTVIGNQVFIGSNSTLVAPLKIADGAFVAAGSTVTSAVPENALAVGRARQENKEGYAARIRQHLRSKGPEV